MMDPAKLRLVCTTVWFDKQILISWHPKKPDHIFFGTFSHAISKLQFT